MKTYFDREHKGSLIFLTYLSVKVVYKLIYCLDVVRNLQAFKPKKILQKKNGTNFRRYQVIE